MDRATKNQVYSQTTVLIPVELKNKAKKAEICLARCFREALRRELETCNDNEMKNNPARINHNTDGDNLLQGVE